MINIRAFHIISICIFGLLQISCTNVKGDKYSLFSSDVEQVIPFGLHFGMNQEEVSAIVDSLFQTGCIVEDDELGYLLCLPKDRRIRLLFGYDAEKGLSEIELTTQSINGEFPEAKRRDVERILSAQKIDISQCRFSDHDSDHGSSFYWYHYRDSIRLHKYYGGRGGNVSASFRNTNSKSDLQDTIWGRKYYRKSWDFLNDLPIIVIIFFGLSIICLILINAIPVVISYKEKRGLPTTTEKTIKKVCAVILIFCVVILFIAAIHEALLFIGLLILCAMAFFPEAFSRKK